MADGKAEKNPRTAKKRVDLCCKKLASIFQSIMFISISNSLTTSLGCVGTAAAKSARNPAA